jgi:hypothetical protein
MFYLNSDLLPEALCLLFGVDEWGSYKHDGYPLRAAQSKGEACKKTLRVKELSYNLFSINPRYRYTLVLYPQTVFFSKLVLLERLELENISSFKYFL